MKLNKDLLFRLARPFVHLLTDKRRMTEIEKLLTRLIPNLQFSKDGVVIDLGANRGDFTLVAAKYARIVYAFEPNPIAYSYLHKRVVRKSNILVFQLAVTDKTELTSFFNHPDFKSDPLGFSIRSSLIRKENDFQELNSKVLTINFAEFVSCVPKIDCLKVDIEGAESLIWPIIMKNKSKIKYLLMEVHDSINPRLRDEINRFITENELSARWTATWI
ncbi:MAG: FkbM family methyltransferase [Gammaproteobacteria bacterium]|nr:FkbM family methyltransferase [Gammaproteobacteria bacterium]